jgi:dihydroorotase
MRTKTFVFDLRVPSFPKKRSKKLNLKLKKGKLTKLGYHVKDSKIKRRQALVKAATSGLPQFFLGTDSAPHPAHLKEHASGCAGCYTAHAAMPMYAEAFDQVNALDKLEGFASFYGADFYGLPRNTGTITLRRESWTPPESFAFGDAQLKPLRSGESLPWRLV